jgi:hypothetical protein
MRNLISIAICMTICSGAPTYAREVTDNALIGVQHAETAPVVQNVTVVDMERLPASIQSQVYSAVANVTEEQLQGLRRYLDTIPAASSALKEQGKSANDVIAAAIDEDGDLTLITMTSV